MPVTDYSIYQGKGVEGQIPNTRGNTFIKGTQDEFVNAHTAAIPYGRVVRQGTNFNEVLPLSAAGQTKIGVTVFSDVYEKAADGTAGVPVDKPLAFLVEGEIYMIAEEAVTTADTVFVRFDLRSSGGGAFDAIGRVRTDADNDGTANAEALSGAKFLTDAAAGEIVRVYVNFN